jgi:hypothetical protein
LFSLVTSLESILDSGNLWTAPALLSAPTPQTVKVLEVYWDGSVGRGAGIGITLGYVGEGHLATFSIPVFATDATRCESLGPALASLLLTRLPKGPVVFRGDSLTVVKLLR